MFDINKDGVLDARELGAVGKVLGYQLPKSDVVDMLKRFDLDLNRSISFEEFLAAVGGNLPPQSGLTKTSMEIGTDYNAMYRKRQQQQQTTTTQQRSSAHTTQQSGGAPGDAALYAADIERHREALQAFQQFDQDGNGFVSREEAMRALQMLGFDQATIDTLLMQSDANMDGKLSYAEFVNFYDQVKARKTGAPVPVVPSGTTQQLNRTPLYGDEIEMQREALAAFQQFDKDGNGFISGDEAQSMLWGVLGFTQAQTNALISQCDANHDGKLSYAEFISFYDKVKQRKQAVDRAGYQNGVPAPVRAAPAPAPAAAPGQLRYNYGQSAAEEHMEALQAFQQYDVDGSGYIDRAEAHRVLHIVLGFTARQTDEFLSSCDFNADGQLQFDEFIHFYAKVKGRKVAIDKAFREFDKEGKGYVTTDDAKKILGNLYTAREVERMVAKHDTNNDGVLQYEEFMTFWTI